MPLGLYIAICYLFIYDAVHARAHTQTFIGGKFKPSLRLWMFNNCIYKKVYKTASIYMHLFIGSNGIKRSLNIIMGYNVPIYYMYTVIGTP